MFVHGEEPYFKEGLFLEKRPHFSCYLAGIKQYNPADHCQRRITRQNYELIHHVVFGDGNFRQLAGRDAGRQEWCAEYRIDLRNILSGRFIVDILSAELTTT
jgi:hypothetical protein